MSLVNRAALAEGLTAFVSRSEAMHSLDEAMRLLYPGRERLPVQSLAELVLLSILRGHEVRTQGVLGRINESLARLLDDLDALRSGRSIEGRTAGMRVEDLTAIAKAFDDLRTLEQQVRLALETDSTWATQLRMELSAALAGPQPTRGPRVGVVPPAVTPAPRPRRGRPQPARPQTVEAASDNLRQAVFAVAPDPQALAATGDFPAAVREAAHNVVVAAGGDVGAAVQRLIAQGGPDADALVVAVLFAEGRLRRGAELDYSPALEYQRSVTGLDFEWSTGPGRGPIDPALPPRAPLPPGALGEEIRIDGFVDGFLVDAKHGGTPTDVLYGQAAAQRAWLEAPGVPVDTALKYGNQPPPPGSLERQLMEYEYDTVQQMARQLEFAEHNGLKGVNWVCSNEELAAAYRLLADRLPPRYRSLKIEFTVKAAP